MTDDDIRALIQQRLDALPGTEAEAAQALERLGVVGKRGSCSRCVIRAYLDISPLPPGYNATVWPWNRGCVEVANRRGVVFSVPLPAHLKRLACNFDDGKHPALER